MIYAVRVAAGQEKAVSQMLYQNVDNKREEMKKEGLEIYSIFYTPELKGYVIVEANTKGTVEYIARGVQKTRGVLDGEITIEQLEKILKPTPITEQVEKGEMVELFSGPFAGEKARVIRVNKERDEVTVELIEAAVPIPVTVKGEDIKVLKPEKQEKENKEK